MKKLCICIFGLTVIIGELLLFIFPSHNVHTPAKTNHRIPVVDSDGFRCSKDTNKSLKVLCY